ncbi:hypothetical protein CLU79DRAFT_832623 [Phycomyces nitens]|nr:hypothetical protein CLU79DRAFT_832623 [Phycomyces nitens]
MADSPHSNTFLKSLSQKKYAWMQAPSATFTQPRTDQLKAEPRKLKEDTRPTKKPRQTKRRASLEDINITIKAEPITKKQISSSSAISPTYSPTTPPIVPLNDDLVPLKSPTFTKSEKLDSAAPKVPQPHFKYTTFPVKGFNILPTRNITSTFVKSDVTYFPGNKAGAAAIMPNAKEEWTDTIVIHPGSRNLRIGLASEAFPKTVPHVIARRLTQQITDVPDEQVAEVNEEAIEEIKGELKWRMKSAKRRAVPNAEGQVIGFNTQAYQELIPDHNDPYKVEWTEINSEEKPDHFVGEKALNLPMTENSDYKLFYPWKHGTLNNQDYTSLQAVMSDLQTIWTDTINTELEIEEKQFEDYNAVLVIPDIFPRTYICELVTVLLRYMKFRGVLVQQESTSATFGAGVSTACVVDIGAQKTNIACIEDGVCFLESRTMISMGGDDITKTFMSFLLSNRFPYADINLRRSHDWRLAEDLKKKWCTMNEADISIQVYDFFVRAPHQPTKKYQCKVYDEVFLAPLCLFYPAILNDKEKTARKTKWISQGVVDDIADEIQSSQAPGISNSAAPPPGQRAKPWTSMPAPSPKVVSTPNGSEPPVFSVLVNSKDQEHVVFPLDVAIAQSIQVASGASEERLKRFFTNIILVGGGGMIGNFNRVLEDRVLSTTIAQSLSIEKVEVLPAPRELDPRLLVWKGASVLSKLEIAKEMWIGLEEWDQVGARCLKDRTLFT